MKTKVKQVPIVVEAQEIPISKESIQLKGNQTIIGISGGLVEGKEYFVSAHTAEVLIINGHAKLKTNI